MAETQLDAYAQERNGPWVHLVKWCLDKYETFKESTLRNWARSANPPSIQRPSKAA